MSDQGKANYEAYRKLAGRPGVSAAPLPEYERLPLDLRYAFDAGAYAVEAWVAAAPVDEDAPGSEPKSATVIVVTEAGGRERHYAADASDDDEHGRLRLGRDGRQIARYQKMAWLSVREDGATVPEDFGTVRALGIAKLALTDILKRSQDYDQPFGRPEVGDAASTALNDIWNETEG